ncbi:MAG: hypothetical protein JXQ73_33785 [Phycisphaerae bacterium]|nr:hypothetical protein [Phycisphaerae bacterium]
MPPAVGGALAGFLGAMWPFFMVLVLRSKVRVSLRRQLVERGIPICIRCGYDLRGQTEPRCPECGTPFAEGLLRRED